MSERIHKIMSGRYAWGNAITRIYNETTNDEMRNKMMKVYGPLAQKLERPASCTRYSPSGRGFDALNVSIGADYKVTDDTDVKWVFHMCYEDSEEDPLGYVYGFDKDGAVKTAACNRLIETDDHINDPDELPDI